MARKTATAKVVKKPPKPDKPPPAKHQNAVSASVNFVLAVAAVSIAFLISDNIDSIRGAFRQVQAFYASATSAARPAKTTPNQHSSRSMATALEPQCLIAIPDIHGDLDQTKKVLQFSGATNAAGEWVAGDCTLVQTGDLVDRGPQSIEVMQHFEELRVKAAAGGGKLVTLLGNHELESIMADFKDISRAELQALGTEALKTASLEELARAAPPQYRSRGITAHARESEAVKAGAARWGALMAAGSWLGDLMRSREAAVVLGEGACRTLFVHAGITMPMIQAMEERAKERGLGLDPVATMNALAKEAIGLCNGTSPCPSPSSHRHERGLLFSNGPFWDRSYDRWARQGGGCDELAEVLEVAGAQQVVVGHTPQRQAAESCGGKLFLMDVGISRWMLGNVAAWRCQGGETSVRQEIVRTFS